MTRQEPLSHAELDKLLGAAKNKSVRDWALLLVMYCHGLRASEVGALQLKDVNRKDWTIRIKRGKGSKNEPQMILPNAIKIRDERRALEEYLQQRGDSVGFLFPNPSGNQLSRIAVYNVMKEHAAIAGLPDYKASPHALKHSLGQHAYDECGDIRKVAAILGHKKIDSSARYAEASFEDLNQVRKMAISKK